MKFRKRTQSKQGSFQPFRALILWWKRRKFYMVQNEDLPEDDDMSGRIENKDSEEEPEQAPEPRLPQETFFNYSITQQKQRNHTFRRSNSLNSCQKSIESMDSLLESCWDPEDENSQGTPLASNTGHNQPDYLVEHIGFLSSQTQPREVEVFFRD